MQENGRGKESKTDITGAGRNESDQDQRKLRGTRLQTATAAHNDEDDPKVPAHDQNRPSTANEAIGTDAHIVLEAANPKSEDGTAVAKIAQPLRTLVETSEQKNHHQARTHDQNQPQTNETTPPQTPTPSPPSSAQPHHPPPALAVVAPQPPTAQQWTSALTTRPTTLAPT